MGRLPRRKSSKRLSSSRGRGPCRAPHLSSSLTTWATGRYFRISTSTRSSGAGSIGGLACLYSERVCSLVGVVSGVPLLISVDLATLGRLGWKERVVCGGTEPPTWDTPPAGEEYSEV